VSTEPKLIVSLINSKNIALYLKIDKSIFRTEEGKSSFNFIEEYFKNYNELPPLEIFKEKYPTFPFNVEYNNPEFFYNEINNQNSRIELARILQEAHASFTNKESIDIITSSLKSKLGNLSNIKTTEKITDIRDNIEKRYDDLLTRQSNEKKERIYTLGHPYLDKLGAIEQGSLNLILARFGIGKTWFGLYLAYKYWQKGLNPLFISIEMPEKQVAERLDSIISGISFPRIKDGTLFPEELQKFKKYVQDMKENKLSSRLNIAAPSKCNVHKIRELAIEYKAGAVFVDYLQLMQDSQKAREKRFQLMNIGNDTREIAKELNIPIFYIAQANRTAIDEIPSGDHIKESDDLGANSDCIISLFQSKELKQAKKMELHITKFRNGDTGNVTVDFDLTYMNFMDVKNPFFLQNELS
jgi:replicative DNA helicase